MKHAIIGCGSIGQRHLKNLASLGEKDFIVVDPRRERREKLATDFGAKPFVEFDDFLAKGVDVAYITLPNSLHMTVARIAARAGCHLFIEKPLSTSLDGIPELIEEVRSQKRVGFVGSNWKFHPAFQKMKALIDEQAFGRVLTARCLAGQYLPDWHPWEDYRQMYSAQKELGGGVIFDSHELDYLSWFLGRVDRISCFSGHLGDLDIQTEDAAALLLRFKNGAIGQVSLDYLQRSYQRRYEFCGTEGTMLWDVNDREVRLYKANEKEWKIFKTPNDYDSNLMYLEELRHFLLCVQGKAVPVTPLERGREVLELMLAAHRSNASGCAVDPHTSEP